jgi:hypothetical protein
MNLNHINQDSAVALPIMGLIGNNNQPAHNGFFGMPQGFSAVYQAMDFSVLEENYVFARENFAVSSSMGRQG